MCGIYVSISTCQPCPPSKQLEARLQSRGPDIEGHEFTSIYSNSGEEIKILVHSTVLSLRGDNVVKQPLVCQIGESSSLSFLCWNGEAWRIEGEPVTGNDSVEVFSKLKLAAARDNDMHSLGEDTNDLAHIERALSTIEGPSAFVFLDVLNKRLFYGRDVLGRRSLLYCKTSHGFILASVADDVGVWTEVDADGVHVIDLNSGLGGSQEDKSADIARVAHSGISIDTLTINHSEPTSLQARLEVHSAAVKTLEDHLNMSLTLRLGSLRTSTSMTVLQHPRIAILFSGGIDCTLLARLSHEHLPEHEPIDLLNVAFENPRIQPHETLSRFDACPDRMTAKTSLVELEEQCPTRQWRLVEINISFAKAEEHRSTIVSLMRPHATEMDLSIAMALYFAARGSGTICAGDAMTGSPTAHDTPARVLLSGLGADELFGGYQRHATAFARRGHAGLIDELALDTARLGKRNLGRDDRIISHWAREARYPFLDEQLVKWAVEAPIWEKCGFGLKHTTSKRIDTGDDLEDGKLVLRLLAWKLGMRRVAREKKRAIQFGTRTAKMYSGKSKGTDTIE